jgi:two-component system cell cycle response regulator CtrA
MERSKNNQSRRTDTVPIQTIVRLSEGYRKSMSRTGKLAVDLGARVVFVDDQPVQLTGKEYAILELLTVQKDTIVTREMLLNHLYGGRDEPELKIIDVFVCKLRKKLAQATGGDHYIETVWGRGYMLHEPVAMVATQTHVRMREPGLSDSSRR